MEIINDEPPSKRFQSDHDLPTLVNFKNDSVSLDRSMSNLTSLGVASLMVGQEPLEIKMNPSKFERNYTFDYSKSKVSQIKQEVSPLFHRPDVNGVKIIDRMRQELYNRYQTLEDALREQVVVLTNIRIKTMRSSANGEWAHLCLQCLWENQISLILKTSEGSNWKGHVSSHNNPVSRCQMVAQKYQKLEVLERTMKTNLQHANPSLSSPPAVTSIQQTWKPPNMINSTVALIPSMKKEIIDQLEILQVQYITENNLKHDTFLSPTLVQIMQTMVDTAACTGSFPVTEMLLNDEKINQKIKNMEESRLKEKLELLNTSKATCLKISTPKSDQLEVVISVHVVSDNPMYQSIILSKEKSAVTNADQLNSFVKKIAKQLKTFGFIQSSSETVSVEHEQSKCMDFFQCLHEFLERYKFSLAKQVILVLPETATAQKLAMFLTGMELPKCVYKSYSKIADLIRESDIEVLQKFSIAASVGEIKTILESPQMEDYKSWLVF